MSAALFLYSAKPHLRQSGDRYGLLRPGVAKQVREIILTMWRQSRLANIGQLAA